MILSMLADQPNWAVLIAAGDSPKVSETSTFSTFSAKISFNLAVNGSNFLASSSLVFFSSPSP